jgi:hypothetical protein
VAGPQIAPSNASPDAQQTSVDGASPITDEAQDTRTLAEKIRAMISSLPPFPTSSAPPTPGLNSPPRTPTIDLSGPPPLPATLPIADSKLAAMLSSPAIMNGSLAKSRESVWALLDRLRAPRRNDANENDTKGKRPETAAEAPAEDDDDDDDNSTVMFCAPLSPTPESELELAPVETVEVDERGHIIDVVSVDDHKQQRNESVHNQGGQPSTDKKIRFWDGWTLPRTKVLGETAEGRVQEVKMWVPSTINISLEARWWGFRMYVSTFKADVTQLLIFAADTDTFRLPSSKCLAISNSRPGNVRPC